MEDRISEASTNLSMTKLPVYYKYRYTFSRFENTLEVQIERAKRIKKYIQTHYSLGDKIVMGIEHYTKGMLATNPHVHIHFISRVAGDTIRKGIMREFDLIGRCQSCKAEVLVDEGKFWRYALKQQHGETKKYCEVDGFSSQEVNQMIDLAYACWLQSAEVSIHKLEKKAEKTSKDRLFAYLDTKQLFLEEEVVRNAYEYYVEHEDTFNVATVNGYIHIYLLKNKIMSYEIFISKHYK